MCIRLLVLSANFDPLIVVMSLRYLPWQHFSVPNVTEIIKNDIILTLNLSYFFAYAEYTNIDMARP